MPALDAILNFMIPFLVIAGMIFLIYKAAKEPIDRLAAWIMKMIQDSKDKGEESVQQFYSEISYE